MDHNESGKLGDMLKKAVSTGIGAALTTEEVVKGLLSDRKEIVGTMIQSVVGAKEDVVLMLKKEVHTYLERLNLTKEIEKVLDNYTMEVSAKINFKKKEENKTGEEEA